MSEVLAIAGDTAASRDGARLVRRAATRLRAALRPASVGLLVELVRAGFKVNDHNSIVGVLWSLITPFGMLGALYLVFRNRFGEELPLYPIYLLLGIVLVNFFATVTRQLMTVFNTQRPLLLDSRAPREIVILAQVGVHAWKLGVEIALCAALALHAGPLTPLGVLRAVPLVVGVVALTTGIGLLLAVAHCFVRDVEHLWALVSRLLLFVTPVFYGLDGLSPVARFAVGWLNPLTPLLEALRGLFIGPDPSTALYAHAVLAGLLFLGLGYAAFLLLEGAAVERA